MRAPMRRFTAITPVPAAPAGWFGHCSALGRRPQPEMVARAGETAADRGLRPTVHLVKKTRDWEQCVTRSGE
ncbi:hypothetical protein GCM10027597_50060 [Saccharopolyspora tripterygii]